MLPRGLWNEAARERFAERWVIESPSKPYQARERTPCLELLGGANVLQSDGKRTIKHQAGHTLRMLHRVRDRNRAATRDPKERKAIQSGRVHHCFEITDPRVEAHIVHVALRHTVAALVV